MPTLVRETPGIAPMRLALAASGLAIIWIDPSEPGRFVLATYTTLVLYVAYAAVLLVGELGAPQRFAWFDRHGHWIDTAWYTLLIGLSEGTNSIFFFGYFLPILTASFRSGSRAGMLVATVSALLFTTIGALASPPGFPLNRYLIRPTYLLILGSMIAYWGEFELTLRRRLALLREITRLPNPRSGSDHAIAVVLERLRAFHGATECLIVGGDAGGGSTVRRAREGEPESALAPSTIDPDLAALLLRPASTTIVVWSAGGGLLGRAAAYGLDVAGGSARIVEAEWCDRVAASLDAAWFAAVPVDAPLPTRLYVVSSRPRSFGAGEARFLLQAVEHAWRTVENVRLLDELAQSASEVERRRIAHDLHDVVLQPYVGLRFGLGALREKALGGEPIAAEVEELLRMTEQTIGSLRDYANTTREPSSSKPLVETVRERLSAIAPAGLTVTVEGDEKLRVGERVGRESLRMITEGLSNVRRHTRASAALVAVARDGDAISLVITNPREPDDEPAPFVPRSIRDRAGLLGGRVDVSFPPGRTAVRVELPL